MTEGPDMSLTVPSPGSFLVIYLNEFGNAVAAYSFQANSTTQGRSWMDAICNVRVRWFCISAPLTTGAPFMTHWGSAGTDASLASPCHRHTFMVSDASRPRPRRRLTVILMSQNQLQKLHSEELRRKQRRAGGVAEEEEESSNSTASSPCLRHKDHQAER